MAYAYRTLLVAAALAASGAAFGQSSTLTTPNNSAGSPMDTPPMVTRPLPDAGMPSRTESSLTAFDKLRSGSEGYVTRDEVARLPGNANFEEADRDRDGRLNPDEFQRFWNDYQGAGQ